MKTLVLLLALTAYIPVETVARDHVTQIEVNRFYNGHGKLIFVQVIFWDHDNYQEPTVVAWRFIKTGQRKPYYDRKRHRWYLRWHDGDTLREVTATVQKETWTQFDPEVADREFVPMEQRRGLFKWQTSSKAESPSYDSWDHTR